MPHQNKNSKSRNTQHLIFLPITGTLFLKTTSKKPGQNSLDFHLDIIKRIDKLLAEHERGTLSSDSFRGPPIIPLQPPSPIEPRTPLNKTLSHQEIAWEPAIEQPQTITQTTPEEFKTELTINPEFRFITSREFIDTVSKTRLSSEERIEIIDLSTLSRDTTTLQKTMNFTQIKNLDDNIGTSSLKNGVFSEEHHHKKIEIIDAWTPKQKMYINASSDTTKPTEQTEQTEQNDKKSQVYYINNKDTTDKKQKKLEVEESYIPVDFDERSKELKEKLQKEQEKRQQIEKIIKQLESEHQKLEKLQNEKAVFEKKKQEFKGKNRKTSKKSAEPTGSKRDLKKQAKEQKRLQRLKIRQARIEEKRHKKEEKQALKIKMKQQRLSKKGKNIQQKQIKQKTDEVVLNDEEEYTDSLEIDEDLRKVLLLTDTLLAELPEEILNQFIHSKEFELYEKILNKYKIK